MLVYPWNNYQQIKYLILTCLRTCLNKFLYYSSLNHIRKELFLSKAEFSLVISKINLILFLFFKNTGLSIFLYFFLFHYHFYHQLLFHYRRWSSTNTSEFKLFSILTLFRILPQSIYFRFDSSPPTSIIINKNQYLQQIYSEIEKCSVFPTDCTNKCIFCMEGRHALFIDC